MKQILINPAQLARRLDFAWVLCLILTGLVVAYTIRAVKAEYQPLKEANQTILALQENVRSINSALKDTQDALLAMQNLHRENVAEIDRLRAVLAEKL